MRRIGYQEVGHAYAVVRSRLEDLPALFYATHMRLDDPGYHSSRYPPLPGKYLATFILHGSLAVWQGASRVDLRPGQVWLGDYRQNGVAYGFDSRQADYLEFLGVIFDGTLAGALLHRLVAAFGHLYELPATHPVVERLLDITHLPDHRCHQTASESAHLITDLLLSLGASAETAGGPAGPPSLARRIEYALREAACRTADLTAIARGLEVSREHASRVFAATYGVSPSVYHQRLRIGEACRLLRNESISVQTVARRLKFANAASLHRAFRREMGVTPGDYRLGVQLADDGRLK